MINEYIFCRLSSRLQLECRSEGDPHTETLGSVIKLGQWQHLAISVLPFNMQPMYKVGHNHHGHWCVLLYKGGGGCLLIRGRAHQ